MSSLEQAFQPATGPSATARSAVPLPHVRLLNEAILLGATEILRLLPNDQRQALEQPVYDAIGRAVRHYDLGLQTMARQLRPLEHGRERL